MFRIDNATAATSLPAPASAGTPGYFTGGDASSGVPATRLSADWANMVQEELAGIPEAAGVTLSKTVRNQVLAALRILFVQNTDTTRFGSNSNGWWEKRANGMIEQWGSATAGDQWSGNYDFPLPFADLSSVNIQATARSGNSAATSGNKVEADVVSLTQFKLGSDDGSVTVFWRAIGR
jgi:hypothetical protein